MDLSQKSIVWVHRFGDKVASYRYRAQIPCEQVAKINGYRTAMNDGEADIVVFSKPNGDELPMARQAKLDGAKVVVDFSDDHFNRDDAYRQFSELADGIVCGSTIMRGLIYDYVKKDSVSIPDPYEQPEREPHADGDKFIWFGHIRNIGEIQRVSHILADRKLLIATGPQTHVSGRAIWGPEALGQALAASNIAILSKQ